MIREWSWSESSHQLVQMWGTKGRGVRLERCSFSLTAFELKRQLSLGLEPAVLELELYHRLSWVFSLPNQSADLAWDLPASLPTLSSSNNNVKLEKEIVLSSCFPVLLLPVSLGVGGRNSQGMERFDGYLDFKEFTETSWERIQGCVCV